MQVVIFPLEFSPLGNPHPYYGYDLTSIINIYGFMIINQ
jgi:hypothetical protein